MKPDSVPHPADLTRRSVLGVVVCTLMGCGGGGAADTAAVPLPTSTGSGGSGGSGGPSGGSGGGGGPSPGDTNVAGAPGTGGTGVTSHGAISAFGSVVVNGIHYDELTARISLDGVESTPAALRLGMVATVQGTRDTSALLGTAQRIDVWSIAQGDIAQLSVQGNTAQFSVSNLSIVADVNTMLEGVSSLSALRPGMRVTVWGLQTNTAATQWRATRVATTSNSQVVTTGLLGSSPDAAVINGWRLDGELPQGWKYGELMRAQGTLSAQGNTLRLDSCIPQDFTAQAASGQEVEVEGVITSAPQNGHFKVGTVTIDARNLTGLPNLTVGMEVEVKGTLSNGVLVAREFELEDESKLNTTELEARIDQFTSLSNFVMRGQRCDASGVQRIEGGQASDLRVGLKIKVKGVRAGDTLMVSHIEIDH